ncbi:MULTISPECIES: SDR family NAD(P)-dependent oxidoreductase [Pseudomonas aeruginosa group]|uniref:SDR family NAD(P)-dependent oxidoreductase n=1 Tax=Pseudomonas aeruginosa group TaxID=136841 RepID=UPI00068E924B|nr:MULTISPECIES: SDR family oxidoreductase [Pseudomonas aeruginosa group]VTS61101.1 3-ketoacyl-ACP reductase [Streptococcus dysgalactiae subsp. equisimilis]AVR67658.1 SDR family NAD(P)-dependent oxidoreductase [Pseudomonas paraeruginosa]KAB0745738.1 SDR family oxidoreductase [Pseudomonas aeruginosa]KPD29242.1 3-oxoacyl-ACP reductase [Pseudomonas paraeruginosa]KQB32355.1 3-oxoacyl-ACP reductase [Pseudomonas paraeruginosa]
MVSLDSHIPPASAGFARYPSLVDRNVLITGGASGIGAAFVEQFARQGARVAFLDVDDAGAAALLARLDDARRVPYYLHCDLTDLGALETAIAAVRSRLGAIGVLVNNAANDTRHGLDGIQEEDFERSLAVNLRHQVFATRAVVPDMRDQGGGSVICLGSTGWMKKNPGYPLYAAAKAAIRGFVNGMARELGQQGIRINCLVPGWVITDKQAQLWLDDAGREEIRRYQCMPGLLQPEALARAALFLAADDSSMCTGQDFIVDGGWV